MPLFQDSIVSYGTGQSGSAISKDGGKTWTEPFELVPYAHEKEQVSCGYTSLLATGRDRFLIIYSDFKHPTRSGDIRKAIKVCEVIVTLDSAKRLPAPKWRD